MAYASQVPMGQINEERDKLLMPSSMEMLVSRMLPSYYAIAGAAGQTT